jgi:hypothetical protein
MQRCYEVISRLDYHIRNILPENVRQLHLFSDGCPGQNLHHTMMQYLHSTVHLGKLDKITHHLPVHGHSYIPCDRLFGITGHMKKKHEKLETYTVWQDLVKENFDIISMNGNQFRDFKDHCGKIFKYSVIKKGAKLNISKTKKLENSAAHKYEVAETEAMSGTVWETFTIQKRNLSSYRTTLQGSFASQIYKARRC